MVGVCKVSLHSSPTEESLHSSLVPSSKDAAQCLPNGSTQHTQSNDSYKQHWNRATTNSYNSKEQHILTHVIIKQMTSSCNNDKQQTAPLLSIADVVKFLRLKYFVQLLAKSLNGGEKMPVNKICKDSLLHWQHRSSTSSSIRNGFWHWATNSASIHQRLELSFILLWHHTQT